MGGSELMSTASGGTAAHLAAKIARIALQIGERDPLRHGNGVKFPYHAAKDVYGWWMPLLAAECITIVPRVLKSKMKQVELPRAGRDQGFRTTFITELTVEFTLVDGITGETLVGSAYGQGEDPSDKGAGKAMTYAQKAFLLGLGMNGAERDNEADAYDDERERDRRRDDDRDDDRRDNKSREDDERSHEGRSVVIGDGNVEGIQRGGRAFNSTEVQIKQLRTECRTKNVKSDQLLKIIDDVLGDRVDVPESDDPGPAIIEYLESLKSTDIGKLIDHVATMKKPAADSWGDDGDPGPSDGR